MAMTINPITGELDVTIGSINEATDVDTSTDTPARDDVLKWNGTNWVPAVYSDTFAMTIASFEDNQIETKLIGSGVWKATGEISFTASYNNPPPASASIACGGTGGVTWASALTLVTPFTDGASAQDTNYPASKDTTIVFTLTAYDGSTPRTATSTVTFRNNIKYGITLEASGWDSADVTALTGVVLSNVYVGSYSVNARVGEYILFAHPSSYTSLHATGFLFNSIACPFQSPATVYHTNSQGFPENYKVYRSTNTNLGNSTLTVSTSSNLINPFYYGGSTLQSGWTEAQIKALTDVESPITNDTTQTFNTITLGANEYFVFAYPSRCTDPTNWYDNTSGFALALYAGSPEVVSITNSNGYTENYDVWVSENILGPGNFTLRTT